MLMLTISGILALVFVSKRISCGRSYSHLGGDAYSAEKDGKRDGDGWDGELRGKLILGMFEEGKNVNSFCGATYGSLNVYYKRWQVITSLPRNILSPLTTAGVWP